MGKRSSSSSSASSLGGIGGSGIFGGVTSGVVCKDDDDSWYCALTKFTSAITQILLLAVIAYLIYFVVTEYIIPFSKKNMRGGGMPMMRKPT